MDPVSYLFSAYMIAVRNEIHQSTTEIIGTELKAVVVEYEGTEIPFQYQLWRIKSDSVCSNTSGNILKHSECTQKASRMFDDMCTSLGRTPNQDWRYVKTKNMYCNAASEFKPVIAKLNASGEQSNLSKARSECNAATVAAMGSNDPQLKSKRVQACKKYETLSKNP